MGTIVPIRVQLYTLWDKNHKGTITKLEDNQKCFLLFYLAQTLSAFELDTSIMLGKPL